jgi:hypothetical protein
LFYYLENKEKDTKDAGNVKPPTREEGPDGEGDDKDLDENANKQLKEQQEQADKADYQSIDENKEKTGLF